MTRKKYRSLAYAIALATSLSAFPEYVSAESADTVAAEAAAEEADAEAENAEQEGVKLAEIKETSPMTLGARDPSAVDAMPSQVGVMETPVEVTDHEVPANAPVASIAAETPSASTEGDRTAEWDASRPTEQMIEEYMKSFEGQTVVDVQLSGAGDETRPTVQAALSQHPGDVYSVKAVEQDREAIFRTGYFYDLYPTFEQVPEGVVITYHLLENPILKDVVMTGNSAEKTEDLEKLLTVQRGKILNSSELHDNVTAIQEKYREDGYILAKIMDMNIDRDGVLNLKINEGILEGYKVKGNVKTKDYVVLREMRQKVGEPFNAKKARRSMQRVYNLGFFEDVNIKMNPGVEPNAVVMELDVKEKRTGTFGVGVGYSSIDGIIGMINVGDTNFLGRGDAISLTFEKSGSDTDARGYTFSYRHPWIDSKETAGTLRLYNRTYAYNDYDTNGNLKEEYMRKYSGGEITLSRPVSEYSTNFITIRNRNDKYERHVSSGNQGDRSTAAWADWREKNFGVTRSVTLEHVTDTRDNIYNPMTGSRVNLSAELAGLGGDFTFQKYTLNDQHYFKVGHAQVVAFRAQYGIGNGEISEFNQYRIGGQDTLRGYRDYQFRGDRVMLGTLEYRFPLFSKVQGAIFTDWGAVWDSGFLPDNGFHGSFGVGFSLNTPLGPIRLDYGRGSQGGRVHFSVGGAF